MILGKHDSNNLENKLLLLAFLLGLPNSFDLDHDLDRSLDQGGEHREDLYIVEACPPTLQLRHVVRGYRDFILGLLDYSVTCYQQGFRGYLVHLDILIQSLHHLERLPPQKQHD